MKETCLAPNKEILNPSSMTLEEQQILANRPDVKAGLWKFYKYLGFLVTYAVFEWTFESCTGNDLIV